MRKRSINRGGKLIPTRLRLQEQGAGLHFETGQPVRMGEQAGNGLDFPGEYLTYLYSGFCDRAEQAGSRLTLQGLRGLRGQEGHD